MESKSHGLPPNKRFRLIHHHGISDSQSYLPAKKRKDSRDPPTLPAQTYCLPAKKRVWALPPQPNSNSILSQKARFDLNAEYNPSFDDENNDDMDREEHSPLEDRAKSASEISEDVDNGRDNDDYEPESEEKSPLEDTAKSASEITEDVGNGGENGDKENEEQSPLEDRAKPASEISEEFENGGENDDDDEPEIEEQSPHEDRVKTALEISENPFDKGGENYDDDDGIVCAVCQSTDGDPSDPIVLCDGCDLMVHASCYGSPLIAGIPDGDWFCAQCIRNDDVSISCSLCPNQGGAMKQMAGEGDKWAHLVCALFVPEVFFRESEGREGIDCSKVPKRRWEERCYVCEEVNGCAIHCSEPKCGLAFHVTCGLKEDLSIEYRQGNKRGDIVAGFCKTHTDLWKKQEGTGKFKIVARAE